MSAGVTPLLWGMAVKSALLAWVLPIPRFDLEESFFARKRLTKILKQEGATYRTAEPFP